MPDSVAGYIEFFRLIIEAINQGKISSREVAGLSDEGVEALITQLQADAQAEVDRGRQIDPA